MHDVLSGLLDLLVRLDPLVLVAATGLFVTAETSVLIGMVVPGDTVVLLAATTATSPGRFALLVAVATLGSLLGETVGYLLGWRFGGRLRHGRLGGPHWAKAEAFLTGRGGTAVAAARFVAIVHAVLPVVAGTVRMPYRRFIGWCGVGAVAWSLLYVGLGAAAGASWRSYGDRLGMAGYVLLGALVCTLPLARMVRRRLRAAAGASRGPSRPTRPTSWHPSPTAASTAASPRTASTSPSAVVEPPLDDAFLQVAGADRYAYGSQPPGTGLKVTA
jgi:membrane-associated protein